MYEAFYNLSEKPFAILPDPEYLYFGERHSRLAYTMLEYWVVHGAGFRVITGEVGCGKTTVIRHLLNQIDQDVTVGLISNTRQDIGELLKWVLLAFDRPYDSNDKVALFDQPQLKELLSRRELEQFAQRVSADFHIEPLAADEVGDYIRHRLRVAAREEPLFEDAAIARIATATGGTLRKITSCAIPCWFTVSRRAPRRSGRRSWRKCCATRRGSGRAGPAPRRGWAKCRRLGYRSR